MNKKSWDREESPCVGLRLWLGGEKRFYLPPKAAFWALVTLCKVGSRPSEGPNQKIEENKVPTKRKNIHFHFSMSLDWADGTVFLGRDVYWKPTDTKESRSGRTDIVQNCDPGLRRPRIKNMKKTRYQRNVKILIFCFVARVFATKIPPCARFCHDHLFLFWPVLTSWGPKSQNLRKQGTN